MSTPPEVVFLRPRQETKRETAWQCLMVEYGVHFAFDAAYQLPEELPADLAGVKAVLAAPEDWPALRARHAERLAAFSRAGGVAYPVRGPTEFQVIDENAIRGDFEMIVASAGLTCDHPALRRRLQGRSFRQLYGELRDGYFLGQLELGATRDPWSEPFSYNIMQTMELFDLYDPAFGWRQRLREKMDALMPAFPAEIVNLDALTGFEAYANMTLHTGDPRYMDFVESKTRQVLDRYERIEGVPVLEPGRDRLLWNECLAHLPPALAAVGAARGRGEWIDLACHTARVVHDLNCDPAKKLWYHAGRPGWHTPALWCRGQGWALTGLVGILRHLPATHPERPRLIGYLEEVLEGLLATQRLEGLWGNVLDDPASRVCTRGAAICCYLYAEARRAGWLAGPALDRMLLRAWQGLRGRIWRDKACTVCCGTGAMATYHGYLSRPHLFYGAAAILRAGVACALTFGNGDDAALLEA
jgi:rhamnogalacturonyl hydrolase YesR